MIILHPFLLFTLVLWCLCTYSYFNTFVTFIFILSPTIVDNILELVLPLIRRNQSPGSRLAKNCERR
jgi:hypothetical protein